MEKQDRDFLLHLESYLARRDGVDKLLKISRYAAKIALSSRVPLPPPLSLRLKSFESSVGLSRKAFRLGKFVQSLNSLRFSSNNNKNNNLLLFFTILAYGGEGIYYFTEQIIWLSKSGLIAPRHAKKLQKMSAWAELIGYAGSVAIKTKEITEIRAQMEKVNDQEEKFDKLKGKLVMKKMSLVQDLADGLMAFADVRESKGVLTDPLLLASAGMVSALISTHKNWVSC